MNEMPLFSLFEQLGRDLSRPEAYWSFPMLAGVLYLAWHLASRLSECVCAEDSESAPFHMSAHDIRHLAFPVLATFILFFLRLLLSAAEWTYSSLIELALPLILSWALARIAVHLARRVFSRSVFLAQFERGISLAIWGGVVLHLTGFADPMIGFLEQISFPLGGTRALTLWQLICGLVTIFCALFIALWLARLIEERLLKATRLDKNVRELFVRFSKSLLLVVALLFSLSLVGIDVTMFSVFGGALAVGLGFGLQKIASSYVSGFILLLDRSVQMGNRIAIDASTTGVVTRITMRYTVLRTGSGVEILIPNETLVGNVVRNFTFSDAKTRLSITLAVAYDTEVKKAMRLMVEAARKPPRVLSDPAPGVIVTEFSDSGIPLELSFWVEGPEAGTGALRSEIALDILEAFRENSIEISCPQREIHRKTGGAAHSAV